MNKEQIIACLGQNSAVLRTFHVKTLYLFGSVARDELKTRDIDMLVEFDDDAHIGLITFSRLQRTLSEMLGSNVDLVTPDALHKALKGRVMQEAIRAA